MLPKYYYNTTLKYENIMQIMRHIVNIAFNRVKHYCKRSTLFYHK